MNPLVQNSVYKNGCLHILIVNRKCEKYLWSLWRGPVGNPNNIFMFAGNTTCIKQSEHLPATLLELATRLRNILYFSVDLLACSAHTFGMPPSFPRSCYEWHLFQGEDLFLSCLRQQGKGKPGQTAHRFLQRGQCGLPAKHRSDRGMLQRQLQPP